MRTPFLRKKFLMKYDQVSDQILLVTNMDTRADLLMSLMIMNY